MPRPLPRYLGLAAERAEFERKLARILLETGESLPRGRHGGKLIGYRSAEDDPARLRGLPAIGRNVAGAIPGTDPLRALMAKENGPRRR